MAKRELIDRNNLESTTITTDDYSGNEVVDVVMMEDVKEAPVITEQEIVKPYLDKIRAEIEKEAFTDVNNSKFISVNRVNQILDKYKTESEVNNGTDIN
ncbi:MAG: hypothetical protein II453_07285 [Alphaproteobacteria bacterium]|nr:hypothetical protein [Alphaproteobacteria bacterium]